METCIPAGKPPDDMTRFPRGSRPGHIVVFLALIPLAVCSCGGGYAARQKAFIESLNGEIGFATLDDLISTMGPPQQSIEAPDGTWYTWRKVQAGAVSGGTISFGFFSMSMASPSESGQELNCQFDHITGRLRTWNYREW